jgi:hypothetical protein
VPVQAQQLESPPPSVGPSVVVQWQLLPQNLSYTASHLFAPQGVTAGAHRDYLALWDVEMSRQLGHKGLVVDAFGDLVLLAALAWVVGRLRRIRWRLATPGEAVG